LIALVMVVLIGFTALAIDGGQLYFLQRDAQNAADAAVMAALFELCRDPNVSDADRASAAIAAGQSAAIKNGFNDAADNVSVTVIVPYTPSGAPGPSYNDVEVVIIASKPAQLVQVVYNGPLEVRARTVGHCEAGHPFDSLGFAMFGGGTDCNPSVNYQGSTHTGNIVGGIHTNGNVAVSGGGTSVDTTTAHGSISTGGGASAGTSTSGVPVEDFPEIWDIDDFRPGGQWAAVATTLGTYHYYSSSINSLPKSGGAVVPGIYFVEGDASFNSADFGTGAVGVTIVTTGEFNVSGGVDVPFTAYDPPQLPPMPLVFANYGDRTCNINKGISMSGSDVFWEGVLYAPNGLINVSGSTSGSMDGCMVGWVVSVSASGFNITCTPDRFPPVKPVVSLGE
jgi:hypothetical protein